MRAINYDFGIEVSEDLAATPRERLLQKLGLIEKVHRRIQEHLDRLDRSKVPHPTPISTQAILNPKLIDTISLAEAALLLGEAPHTVRRMADEGELSVKRTRKGHRRFSREEIERRLREDGVD